MTLKSQVQSVLSSKANEPDGLSFASFTRLVCDPASNGLLVRGSATQVLSQEVTPEKQLLSEQVKDMQMEPSTHLIPTLHHCQLFM